MILILKRPGVTTSQALPILLTLEAWIFALFFLYIYNIGGI